MNRLRRLWAWLTQPGPPYCPCGQNWNICRKLWTCPENKYPRIVRP